MSMTLLLNKKEILINTTNHFKIIIAYLKSKKLTHFKTQC